MPEMNAARRARAREQVAARGADAALITSRANVRYLTGLASSNAALLLPAAGPEVLATDSRYAEAAARDCPDVELVIDRFIEPALAMVASSRGLRTLAFEAQEMTVERHQELTALDGGPSLIPFGRAIEELRVVKDEAEIELLARACAITSEACAGALAAIRPGLTEREFAVLLERRMIDHGAEALAFDTIVASGPNGAIPHHVPGSRPFAAGDLITIDCGAGRARRASGVAAGHLCAGSGRPAGRDPGGQARGRREHRRCCGQRPDRRSRPRCAFPARARPRCRP